MITIRLSRLQRRTKGYNVVLLYLLIYSTYFIFKRLGLYLLGQNCLHLTFEQYLSRYHGLVFKTNVHEPGYFQYTIHYDGKSFSCPRTRKGCISYYMHISSFKICSQFCFSVSHFTSHFFAKTLT